MSRGVIIHLLLLLALASLCVAPFCGKENIPFRAILGQADDCAKVDILWTLRIPRVLLAFFAGATLATGGMVFQAIFRNPLATPFTLGVSSGASLAATVCVQQQWAFVIFGISSATLSAFFGAAISVGLLWLLVTDNRRFAPQSMLLLAGITFCFIFSILIILVQIVGNDPQSWIGSVLGGLHELSSFHELMGFLPWMASGALVVWYFLLSLNLLSTGEDFAFIRGVNVAQTKLLLLFATSIMVGAVTAACGPIGFVGLIAPNVGRRLVGHDHRYLFPATYFLGGSLLLICDTAARLIPTSAELPVGLITACLGGPFFLWTLLADRRNSKIF